MEEQKCWYIGLNPIQVGESLAKIALEQEKSNTTKMMNTIAVYGKLFGKPEELLGFVIKGVNDGIITEDEGAKFLGLGD